MTHTVSLDVPPHHPCYEAHFEGNPIVPGALMLKWIFDLISLQYDGRQVQQVGNIKFMNVARPGDACTLSFTLAHDQTT